MKAKKIVTKSTDKPQPPDAARPKRRTPVYTALCQTTNGIEALRNFTASKGQIQEATKALFTVIANAQRAVGRLAGKLEVITQAELQYVMECGFSRRFESGCPIEPGKWFVIKDAGGAYRILDRALEPACVSQKLKTSLREGGATRGLEVETPTPAQLQAWFDLPSDRPPAADSPASEPLS